MPKNKVRKEEKNAKSNEKKKVRFTDDLFKDALREWDLAKIHSMLFRENLLNKNQDKLKDCLLKDCLLKDCLLQYRINPQTKIYTQYSWLVTLLYNINIDTTIHEEIIYKNIIDELTTLIGKEIILEVMQNFKKEPDIILSNLFLSKLEVLENTSVSDESVNENEIISNHTENNNSNQASNNDIAIQKRSSQLYKESNNTATSNQENYFNANQDQNFNDNDSEEEYIVTNEFFIWFNSLPEAMQDSLLKSSHIQELITHLQEANSFIKNIRGIVTELLDSSTKNLHKAIWYNNENYLQKSELNISKEANNIFEEESPADFNISSISNVIDILPVLPQEFLPFQAIFINLNYDNDITASAGDIDNDYYLGNPII